MSLPRGPSLVVVVPSRMLPVVFTFQYTVWGVFLIRVSGVMAGWACAWVDNTPKPVITTTIAHFFPHMVISPLFGVCAHEPLTLWPIVCAALLKRKNRPRLWSRHAQRLGARPDGSCRTVSHAGPSNQASPSRQARSMG